jgi:hypothetical protein
MPWLNAYCAAAAVSTSISLWVSPPRVLGLHGRCLGAQQTINGSVRRIQPILNS